VFISASGCNVRPAAAPSREPRVLQIVVPIGSLQHIWGCQSLTERTSGTGYVYCRGVMRRFLPLPDEAPLGQQASRERQMALSRWENEGGSGPPARDIRPVLSAADRHSRKVVVGLTP
jgi:hypothetical protein